MLNSENFAHLQKLSCIHLGDEEEKKLSTQLGTVVDFLGKLTTIKIDADILDGSAHDIIDHDLVPITGVQEYQDTNSLFQNVKHEKINNSIVIKSVMEE